MKSGTASPTPHALTPRQQCPRCGGARQRRLLCVATTTPQSQHGGAQGRRLLRVTLRHHSVDSRFSLKHPPGVPCGGTTSAQGFLSKWSLEPTAEAREGCLSPSPSPGSILPWSCCRQTSTSTARCGGPVPAPRWSRRTTALLHAPCSSKRAPVHPLRQGVELASAHYERPSGWLSTAVATAGPLPFKAKEVVLMQTKHETVLVQRRALQAPEVMLDDAVQARPGYLRHQQLRRAPKVAAPLRPATCTPYGAAAVGYH